MRTRGEMWELELGTCPQAGIHCGVSELGPEDAVPVLCVLRICTRFFS